MGVGLGLACSKAISNGLNGDSYLIESEPGLTIMEFVVPVRITKESQKSNIAHKKCIVLNENKAETTQKLKNYLVNENLGNLIQMGVYKYLQ